MLIIIISVILGLISGLYFKNRAHFCFTFLLLLFIIFSFFKSQYYYNSLSNKDINSQFKIIYKEKETTYTTCYIAEDLSSNLKRVKLYLNGKNNFCYGDIIVAEGSFKLPNSIRNDGGFDYRLYLKTKGITGFVYADTFNKLENKLFFIDLIFKYIYSIRAKCDNILDNTYIDNVCDFLKCLLLADTSTISKEIKENFQDANLSHILAISGLHVSYVVMLINKGLQRIKIGKGKKYAITIIFLIVFLIVTNCQVSCLRAVIMEIMALLAFILKRKSNFINNLFISIIIILLINPYNAYNSGMWLSYGGTIGIVFLAGPVEKQVKIKIESIKKRIKLKFFIFDNKAFKCFNDYVIKVFSVSLAVYIIIFPIMWFCYGSISLTFFISNIIISGIIGYIIILGFLSIIEGFIWINIYSLLMISLKINFTGSINSLLVKSVLFFVRLCSKIPLEKIYLSKPSWLFLVVYYLIIILLFVKPQKLIRKIFLVFIIFSIIITQIDLKIDNFLEIYMLDVGQGDSVVLITPDNKVIVVDSGEGGDKANLDYGKSVVYPFLLAHKKHKIDYLIISHMDLDHVGGSYYLLENIKVNHIITCIQTVESSNFSKLIEIANSKNIEISYLKGGDSCILDDFTNINVLWPDVNNIIYDNTINNMSLVFKLNCNNKSILFTGDIEELAENAILSSYNSNVNILKSDIIKVPHHGSKSSSIYDFINMVNPKIALIGVGEENKFGHPNAEVLRRYEKIGSIIYRTDLLGQISIKVSY